MKHWVFDLDGTLVDSLGHYDLKLGKIFNHYGIPFGDEEQKKSHDYFDAREFFGFYLPQSSVDEAWNMLQVLSVEMAVKTKVFDGIVELLDFLEQSKVHLSLWTGRDYSSAQKILEHTGLQRFFKAFVSGTCVGKVKPDPEGLLKLIDITGHKNSETVMIGDHCHDINGAKSVGVQAFSVSWSHSGSYPLEQLSDQHFFEVSSLHSWVKNHFEINQTAAGNFE